MNFDILNLESTSVSYEQLVALMHDSFKEQYEAGIHFTGSVITIDWLKDNIKNSIVIVALDHDSSELLGMIAFEYSKNKKEEKYAYLDYIAVASKVKYCGIGKSLMQTLIYSATSNGCRFILSDTCSLSENAINFHLRYGFSIVGLKSYSSTDYWSYKLRYQISRPSLWNCHLYKRIRYYSSCIFAKITKDINGNYTQFGKLYIRLCKNCR